MKDKIYKINDTCRLRFTTTKILPGETTLFIEQTGEENDYDYICDSVCIIGESIDDLFKGLVKYKKSLKKKKVNGF